MRVLLQLLLATFLGVGSCFAVSWPEFELVTELPAHVATEAGRMTLFADYSAVTNDGQFPVFLVNRTSEYVEVGSQDGDFYLKLEVLVGETWIRAQPHQFSWCGNSYFDRLMHPGDFVRLVGYQPASGDTGQVRYSFYNQGFDLVSNAGEGIYSKLDVSSASWDELSVREGNFDHVSAIALREAEVEDGILWLAAIGALADERFEASRSLAVLRMALERFPDSSDQRQVLLSIRRIEGR